jgi:pantetheine-phosphate adenylyltransferase
MMDAIATFDSGRGPMAKHALHTAVYTGSFDPITLGHLNIIERSSRLFDRLIVGIGINTEKAPLFTPDERVDLAKQTTRGFANVEVRAFDGLAVRFVRECGARVMIRGVRPLADVAGEFTMMMANRQLDPEIETVFLMADDEFVHVSSSLLKQVATLAGDGELACFVTPEVVAALRKKIAPPQNGHAEPAKHTPGRVRS